MDKSSKEKASKRSARKKATSGVSPEKRVIDYRHKGAKRKNNPPAQLAAAGSVPPLPKIRYLYNPRLAPSLRFDPSGVTDRYSDLVTQAQIRPLDADEANLLAEAL